MTFSKIVWKNFTFNFKKYIIFFICSTLTIAIFLIFVNLCFDENISAFMRNAGRGAQYVLVILTTCIFIFSVGFMSYICVSMNRARAREFGLYMTLGMTKRDISKLIVMENSVLISMSMIAGTLIGAVFSRLIHLITVRIMQFEDVRYTLYPKSFAVTVIVFALIYVINLIISIQFSKRLHIRELLIVGRKSEYTNEGSKILTFTGLCSMAILLMVSILSAASRSIALKTYIVMPAVLLGIGGTFIVISNLTGTLSNFLKKSPDITSKHLLTQSELKYLSKKNRMIIFIMSILCMTIVYSSGPSIALLNITNDIVDSQPGPDMSYISAFNVNNFSTGEVENRLKSSGVDIKENKNYTCGFIYFDDYSTIPVCIMPTSEIANLIGQKIILGDSEGKLLISDPLVVTAMKTGKLFLRNSSRVSIKYMGTIINSNFCDRMLSITKSIMVVNDATYKALQDSHNIVENGKIHYLWLDDWHKSKDTYEWMVRQNNVNELSQYLAITGKYEGYQVSIRLYSSFIFVFNFMSILFFGATIVILMFRQYEGLDGMTKKYMQLRKIGITNKEFRGFVNMQTRFIFYTPLAFGFFLATCLIFIMQSAMGGGTLGLVKAFWKACSSVMVIYVAFQMLFCRIVSAAYYKKILHGEDKR